MDVNSLARITRTRFVASLAALVLASGCTSIDRSDDEMQVRTFVDNFINAVNAADTDAFVACFANDATAFFPSQGNAARRTGRAAIRAAVAPTFAHGKPQRQVVPADLEIQLDAQSALVTFDGGSGAMHARRTLWLRREPDGWRIVHLHASNVSEPRAKDLHGGHGDHGEEGDQT